MAHLVLAFIYANASEPGAKDSSVFTKVDPSRVRDFLTIYLVNLFKDSENHYFHLFTYLFYDYLLRLVRKNRNMQMRSSLRSSSSNKVVSALKIRSLLSYWLSSNTWCQIGIRNYLSHIFVWFNFSIFFRCRIVLKSKVERKTKW